MCLAAEQSVETGAPVALRGSATESKDGPDHGHESS
jgi:hypothetical protein